jgi:two-component system, cell cycle sensor histidine kinase and response regulator CckA
MNDPSAAELSRLLQAPGVRSAAQREFLKLVHELQVHQAESEVQSAELRQIQEDLEAAQERYFELYELAPVGYITLDTEGRIEQANLSFSKLLGTPRGRLLGTRLADLVSPSHRSRLERFCAEAIARAPGKNSVEVSVRGAAGLVPVLLETGTSEATSEATISLRIAVVDLTILRRAEERVREREARLKAVLDNALDGIITVAQNGKIESCNPAAARAFGTSAAWLIGQAVNRIMPGFERLAGKGRQELVAERADGKPFVAEVGVSALRSGNQAVLVGVISDISERKRREAELKEALSRFQQIAEHIDDAIFVVEADTGRSLYVSPAFESIWGRSTAEAQSEPWPRLSWIHEEDRERVAEAAAAFRSGGSFDHEYRVVRPDGAVRSVRCRAFHVAEHNRLTGIVHDMTDELTLQAELRQAQRLEAIGTLASGIAHDFNNLLMGVGGCAQLALRRLDPEHEAYGYLRRAVDAILRGANLTRQILRFSDTRRTADEPVEIDIVVSGARDLIHSLVGEHISLSVIAGAPGLCIAADPGDVEQVLLNLASNARDAMPDGGALFFRTEPYQGGTVALSVRDTGIGMDEETKQRVFEPFFTTKEVGKGTGLGLSTVFAVVRRMGGRVSLDSTPGEGTTFTLYLPVVIPDPSSKTPLEDVNQGQGQTILIVDDDPLIRLTVETHVESLGYRALTAANVTDALKVYSDCIRPIDVVLTDIMMPGLLGSDLGRILEKSSPDVAVIFMSAHPWQDLVRQGHLKENAQLLAKPFDTRDLGAALHRALRDKPPSVPPARLRVFVVDDDADVVDALTDLLEMEGHEVRAAKTPIEALRQIPEFAPDIALCDLNMNDAMNGYELVSRLKKDDRVKETVFLAVTGMAPTNCKPAALAAGFEDVLTKPLDFRMLSRLLVSRVRK